MYIYRHMYMYIYIYVYQNQSKSQRKRQPQPTTTQCNKHQLTAAHNKKTIQVTFEKAHQTLQHTATHCNTLQHTATHCNTLIIKQLYRWLLRKRTKRSSKVGVKVLAQHRIAVAKIETMAQFSVLQNALRVVLQLLVVEILESQLLGNFVWCAE